MTFPDSEILLIRSLRAGSSKRVNARAGRIGTRQEDRDYYYSFDPMAEMLTQVGEDRWDEAIGSVSTYTYARRLPKPFRRDTSTWQLKAGGTIIPAAGDWFHKMALSPSGRFAAVLSADADGQLNLPFIGGYAGCTAQHYCQLLSVDERAWVGGAISIPMISVKTGLDVFWSPDERYVVVLDIQSVCIIPVDTSGESRG